MPFELKRRPRYLSYSSMSMFEKNPDEFYLKYLASTKAPSLPQTDYMSVGSGFDAYVKNALHSALFGPGSDPQFEFDAIFTEQVEEHNRDFAREAGQYIFDCYVLTGAYDELLEQLKQSIEPPRFETKVEGVINGTVPFTGKPDLRWMMKLTDEPLRLILDWKVCGFCSKYAGSPSKGYKLCRDGYKVPEGKKQSQSHLKSHNQYLALNHRGFEINAGYMETCNVDYADQVSVYGWLLGEAPGDENVVVCIDEIVTKPVPPAKPLLRVANHRARVQRDYQLKLLSRITECWDAVTTGHIFRDLSREDSDSRCEVLEEMSVGLQTDGTSQEDWFNEVTRPQFKR